MSQLAPLGLLGGVRRGGCIWVGNGSLKRRSLGDLGDLGDIGTILQAGRSELRVTEGHWLMETGLCGLVLL